MKIVFAIVAALLAGDLALGVLRAGWARESYDRQEELLRRESPQAARRRAEATQQLLFAAAHQGRAALEAEAARLEKEDPDTRAAWVSDEGAPAHARPGDAQVVLTTPLAVEGKRLTVGLAYRDHELEGDLHAVATARQAAIAAVVRQTISSALALVTLGAAFGFAALSAWRRRRAG